jgi:hypothetical protein
MKVERRMLILLISAITIPSASAKDRPVRSADSFDSMLARAPYSVVFFYDKSRETRKDPATRGAIKGLETMIRSLSKDPGYQEADLQFLRVDIARRNLSELAQRYRVQTFPTAILFLGREATGSRLVGKLYRDQLRALINRTFKTQMQSILKEKEEKRKRDLERARIRAYNAASWGPYWGWGSGYGYPYWGGYGGSWGRPGIYFGF